VWPIFSSKTKGGKPFLLGFALTEARRGGTGLYFYAQTARHSPPCRPSSLGEKDFLAAIIFAVR